MILDSYAAFLNALSIPFNTSNGFSVSINEIVIWLQVSPCGTVTLDSYIGLVNFIRPAKRLVFELQNRWPQYKFWPEKYSGYYEIEIEQVFPFTSVQALHEKVMAMAAIAEEGYTLGKENVGDEFCR